MSVCSAQKIRSTDHIEALLGTFERLRSRSAIDATAVIVSTAHASLLDMEHTISFPFRAPLSGSVEWPFPHRDVGLEMEEGNRGSTTGRMGR